MRAGVRVAKPIAVGLTLAAGAFVGLFSAWAPWRTVLLFVLLTMMLVGGLLYRSRLAVEGDILVYQPLLRKGVQVPLAELEGWEYWFNVGIYAWRPLYQLRLQQTNGAVLVVNAGLFPLRELDAFLDELSLPRRKVVRRHTAAEKAKWDRRRRGLRRVTVIIFGGLLVLIGGLALFIHPVALLWVVPLVFLWLGIRRAITEPLHARR